MAPLTLALLAWIVAANLVGFILAVADKRRARRNARRVPELVFHVLAVLGGWPAEMLAFRVVHHKTRKASFLTVFTLACLLNLVVVALWLSRSLG